MSFIDFESYFKQSLTSASSFDMIQTYPNPANNIIYLEANDFITDNSIIYIYSSDGKLVGEQTCSGDDIEKIDVSNLQNGMYLITVKGSDVNKNGVFIISE
ncbi:MAG: T9SS type A sorting domain-containing protein [Fimbriimonadaceae bacterium]|nr:T9SS type A sorting domain-containing protein [Chitinophagales bacterium]